MSNGLDFERKVVHQLQDLRCDLLTCEDWDHGDKVDFVITKVDGRTLRYRAPCQLTKQGGNLHKLETFQRAWDPETNDARYYFVPWTHMGVGKTAAAIKDFFVAELDAGGPRPGLTGVFLNLREPRWEKFVISERIAHLRDRADPKLTADRRLTGQIADVVSNGIAIAAPDGTRYFAFFGDLVDARLSAWFKNQNQGGRSLIGREVSFVPHVSHGRSGGYKALSVLFA